MIDAIVYAAALPVIFMTAEAGYQSCKYASWKVKDMKFRREARRINQLIMESRA